MHHREDQHRGQMRNLVIPEDMAGVAAVVEENFQPTGDERLDTMLRGMWLEGTMVAMCNKKVIEQWKARYWTLHHLVLDRGQAFIPQVLPSQWTKGEPQQCFHNSFVLATQSGLTYVEGFAWRGGLIVHHAWVADPEDRVIDVTWDDPETAVYWGIPMPTDDLFKRLGRRDNTLSILDDWEQDFQWLRNGWDL